MDGFNTFDWDNAPVQEAIDMVTHGTTEQIDRLARTHSWRAHPIQVMAAVLRRPDCPLGTALTIFLRCAPGSVRDDDEPGLRSTDLRLAGIIERAVNAGHFRHDPQFGLNDHARMMIAAYVAQPGQNPGRDWGLDPRIVAPLLAKPAVPQASDAKQRSRLDVLLGPWRPWSQAQGESPVRSVG